MIAIKSEEELARLRDSARVAARVRDRVVAQVRPGSSTAELSRYAGELLREYGAESAFLGYRGYPAPICVSVNEAVVHGIPGDRLVQMGDIVSIDVGVRLNGFIGDTAVTVMVGVTDSGVINLVRTTEAALEAGIAEAKEGRRLSDISHAIEKAASAGGCSVVREFVGHGIGRKMHEEPQIPNYGPPGRGPRLSAGMTFCLEPMVNMGGHEVDIGKDGWTVETRDRQPSAHFEHMIVVGRKRAEILTL